MIAMIRVLAIEKTTVVKMIAKKIYIITSKSSTARKRLGAICFQVRTSMSLSPISFRKPAATASTRSVEGRVAGHESGHIWGLSHTMNNYCDVMSFSSNPCPTGEWTFPDADATIKNGGTGCDGSTTQNAYQVLLRNLGPWPGGPKPDPGISCGDAGGGDTEDDDADTGGSGGAGGDADGVGRAH